MRAHAGKTYTRRPLLSTSVASENVPPPGSPTKPAPAVAKPKLAAVPARPLLERSPNSSASSVSHASAPDTHKDASSARPRCNSSSAPSSSRPPPVALTRPRRRATLRPIDYSEPTEDDIPRRPSTSRFRAAPGTQRGSDNVPPPHPPQAHSSVAPAPPRARTSSSTNDRARPRATTSLKQESAVNVAALREATGPAQSTSSAVQTEAATATRSTSLRRPKRASASSKPRPSARLRPATAGSTPLDSDLEAIRLSDEPSVSQPRPLQSHSSAPPHRAKQAPVPEHLVPLLKACGQARVLDFARYVHGFDMELVKIGEASYSEVFATLDRGQLRTVLKVIPLRAPSTSASTGAEQGDEQDMPEQTNLEDALREVKVTHLLNMVRPLGPSYFSSHTDATPTPTGRFVDLLGARVVRGVYPTTLMHCWHKYKESNYDEALNASPKIFTSDQHYLVLELVHGGTDLEHYVLGSWLQAASIFWQVVRLLASAEAQMEFEHRDLHWGNLLVRPHLHGRPASSLSASPTTQPRGESASQGGDPSTSDSPLTPTTVWRASDPSWAQVEVTIIDFTLSRLRDTTGEGGAVLYSDLSLDPELFRGQGDEQFQTYRSMRRVTADDWAAHRPATTVLWLQYLLEKLTRAKGLSKPSSAPGDRDNLYAYRLLSVARVFLHKKTNHLTSATAVLRWAATSRLFDTLYAKES